jgi:Flp pilus assembly CpaF family ATPase
MFDKVNFVEFMVDKFNECDAWLNGKDIALKKLGEAERAYEEAKKDVEEYTEENIAQVENYKKDLEDKLIALGVIEPKVVEEAVEEAPVVEEVVAEEQVVVSPVVVM